MISEIMLKNKIQESIFRNFQMNYLTECYLYIDIVWIIYVQHKDSKVNVRRE